MVSSEILWREGGCGSEGSGLQTDEQESNFLGQCVQDFEAALEALGTPEQSSSDRPTTSTDPAPTPIAIVNPTPSPTTEAMDTSA